LSPAIWKGHIYLSNGGCLSENAPDLAGMTPTDKHRFRKTFAAAEIDGLDLPSKCIVATERALEAFLESRGLRSRSWLVVQREKKRIEKRQR
jgi:hypothetical protein